MIAGNNDRDLQPMVKGNNLREFLSKNSKRYICSYWNDKFYFYKTISTRCRPCSACPPLAPPVQDPITGLPSVAPSPTLAAIAAADAIQVALDIPSQIGQQANTAAETMDYLNPVSLFIS